MSQDHFKLIKRETLYLAGEHYLTVNFLRCDDPTLVLRVIAFDNDTCSSYSFDLVYDDIMLFVDGNPRFLEPENQNELCQMIMNNLTKYNSKDQLGENSVGSADDGGSNDGDNALDRADTKYSRMITQRDGMEVDFERNTRADITLAVEHKIFFNEAYKQEYERNKVIIAKLDKRKKGLHVQDKQLSTEFEQSIVYEAYDTVYSETMSLTSQSNASSTLTLTVIKGRMSENMILRI